jgi:hypothetical protein
MSNVNVPLSGPTNQCAGHRARISERTHMDIGGLDSFSKILFAEWPISWFLTFFSLFPSFGNNVVRPIKFGLLSF